MLARKYVIAGICSAVTIAAAEGPPGDKPGSNDEPAWDVVPEETLREARGGMDLGGLVGYFAIDRVVEVDGQVVAKMQIVVSNLDRISSGGMPTISVSGPLSELVQVMNGAHGAATVPDVAEGSTATAVDAPKASSQVASAPAQAHSASAGTAGNSASVSASTTASGSQAQLGSAVAAANSPVQATVELVPQGSTAPATNVAAAPAANVSTAPAANVAAAGPSAAASAANATAGITKIIPVGTTGQFVVVSNLPNAPALTTAIQNQVRATTISTQTTITASLNSLSVLNSLALGNAIQQQVAIAVGR